MSSSKSAAAHTGRGDCGIQARVTRSRRATRRREGIAEQRPTRKRFLPAIVAPPRRRRTPKSRAAVKRGVSQAASPDRATQRRHSRCAKRTARRSPAAGRAGKKGGTFASRRRGARRGCGARCPPSKTGSPPATSRQRIFSGISLGTILLLAALGLAITYGLMGVINMARRADHDRRLRDLRRAGPVPPICARRVRLLPCQCRRLRPADSSALLWTHGHPPSVRPPLKRAGDLGFEPHPHPGGAHDLRRAERPGREPGVDVGRHRDRAAVERVVIIAFAAGVLLLV